MKRTLLTFVLSFTAALAASAAVPESANRAWLASGGSKLDAVTLLRVEGHSLQRGIDQPETAGGTVPNVYQSFVDTLDLAHGRAVRQLEMLAGNNFRSSFVVTPERESVVMSATGFSAVHDDPTPMREWLLVNPVALARAAHERAAAAAGRDAFTLDVAGARAQVQLDPDTNLPRSVTLTRPYGADSGRYWGDVTTEYRFGMWYVFAPGIRFPTRVDMLQNGELLRSMSIEKLVVNAPVDETLFNVAAAMPRHEKPGEPIVAAPGVWVVPGSWNVTIVQSGDGVWIVEAPQGSDYSEEILAIASRLTNGAPVRGVVSTGSMSHYVAGVRPYVARKIPIYAMPDTAREIRAIVAAPFTTAPDALQRHRVAPVIHELTDATTVGTGDNAMRLVPLRSGMHRLGIVFPALHLLYASDLFAPNDLDKRLAAGSPLRQEVSMWIEFLASPQGAGIDRIYGMHVAPTPLAEYRKKLVAAEEMLHAMR